MNIVFLGRNKIRLSQFVLLLLFLLFVNATFSEDRASTNKENTDSVKLDNKDSDDSNILNQFLQSRGYVTPIFFDSSNIKQFWTSKNVLSKDGKVYVLLNNGNARLFESDLFPFQLINVDWSQDCRIDIISENHDLGFTIFNAKEKEVSKSTSLNDFLNYHVYSTVFHLEDIVTPSFSIKLSSKEQKEITIKKIIMSFPNNPQTTVCFSPGSIRFSPAEIETKSIVENDSGDSFTVKGKQSNVLSKKIIFLSDNPISYSLSIKNVGSTATHIYLGYVPYSKDGIILNSRNYAYPNEKSPHKVISYDKEHKRLVIDSVSNPNTIRGQFLALNAEEDFSDIPNFDIIGRISEAKTIEDNTCEITLREPASKEIPVGLFVRVHATGGTYPYIENKVLQPGEEFNRKGTIKNDNEAVSLLSTIIPKGVCYFAPVILSFTEGSNEENIILIKDFSISY